MTTGIPHGPLTGQDLPKLTGRSVLRFIPGDALVFSWNLSTGGRQIAWQPRRLHMVRHNKPGAFEYLGEWSDDTRTAILAPEGGWRENPFGDDRRVWWKSSRHEATAKANELVWWHGEGDDDNVKSVELIEDAKPDVVGDILSVAEAHRGKLRAQALSDLAEMDGGLIGEPEPEPKTAEVKVVPSGWRSPDEIPECKKGDLAYRIVAVKRRHSGQTVSFSASYLNAVPLWFEDENGSRAVTGWNSDEEGDDGPLYRPLLSDGDELMGWREFPVFDPASPPAETGEGRELAERLRTAEIYDIEGARHEVGILLIDAANMLDRLSSDQSDTERMRVALERISKVHSGDNLDTITTATNRLNAVLEIARAALAEKEAGQ
jgi:hypothetical protein